MVHALLDQGILPDALDSRIGKTPADLHGFPHAVISKLHFGGIIAVFNRNRHDGNIWTKGCHYEHAMKYWQKNKEKLIESRGKL